MTRDEAIAHAAALAAAVAVPVSADLENCFADGRPASRRRSRLRSRVVSPAGRSRITRAAPEDPIYPLELSAERVAAAAAAAHSGPVPFVLTARAENYLHGRPDLDDTIARLQAYEAAGADVLFAPGVRSVEDLRTMIEAVSLPVSAIGGRGMPTVGEQAALGVARISTGGSLAFTALGALVEAAVELRDEGTYGYSDLMAAGWRAAREAFKP